MQDNDFINSIQAQLETEVDRDPAHYLSAQATPQYVTATKVKRLQDQSAADTQSIRQQITAFSTQLPLPTPVPLAMPSIATLAPLSASLLGGIQSDQNRIPACGSEKLTPPWFRWLLSPLIMFIFSNLNCCF